MTKKQMNVNGIQLQFEDQGQGHAVVLLHGYCGSSLYWKSVIPSLSSAYRVIAPDLRGHGNSEALDEPYTIEIMASDIAELLNKLQVPKAVVLGHSLGGYVTLAFAEAYAERLAGFGLVHSTPFPDDEKGKENRLKAIDNIRQNGIEAFIDGLIPKLFAPDHLHSMADKVQEAKEIGYATKPEGAIQTALAMRARPDRNHVLQQTSLPVLLVAGGQDQIIPVGKTFTVQKDNVSQVRFDDTGHMSMMENPDELAKAIKRFLQSVYAG